MPEATAASDLMLRSPAELAQLVRTGEVSARELVEASLERIEALDPQVNAFTTLDAERALATADSIDKDDERPFAGVPIAIKDLFPVAGVRLSMASDLMGDFTPDVDAHVVRRVRDAGFVVVGVTNTPEVGILPVTEPRRFGPTRNPWDLDRTSGGSSGGAAAAVAAGMVPVAHGSDGGGSIRIPAACCGLVGLKPSRNRISFGPHVGEHFTTVHGCLTRTVSDTAAMLDLLAGYELGDANTAPPPLEPFASQTARVPDALRIGIIREPPIAAQVDPVADQAITDAAELLRELGHSLEESRPPWHGQELLELFTTVFCSSISMGVATVSRASGRALTEEVVEPLTWEIHCRTREVNAVDYLTSLNRLQAMARGFVMHFAPYDAVLMPALAERPVPIGEIDACAPNPMDTFARSGRFTPFTAVANVTGVPAISLPLFQGDDGLPLGVQLMGKPFGEGPLLALAAQLEAARPWADRLPELAS